MCIRLGLGPVELLRERNILLVGPKGGVEVLQLAVDPAEGVGKPRKPIPLIVQLGKAKPLAKTIERSRDPPLIPQGHSAEEEAAGHVKAGSDVLRPRHHPRHHLLGRIVFQPPGVQRPPVGDRLKRVKWEPARL